MEKNRRINGLVDYIAGQYRSAVEIGIGHSPDVAYALMKRGIDIFATDIYHFPHEGIRVIVDDITVPDVGLYSGVDLIYSLRTPGELVPYMIHLAEIIHADLIVKPLSSEFLNGRLMSYGEVTFYLWLIFCRPELVSGSRRLCYKNKGGMLNRSCILTIQRDSKESRSV